MSKREKEFGRRQVLEAHDCYEEGHQPSECPNLKETNP